MDDFMFGEFSFLDEVDTKEQARECVTYLALNEHTFITEMYNAGKDYEFVEGMLQKVWSNLIQSCQRVGYSDSLVEGKARQYANG